MFVLIPYQLQNTKHLYRRQAYCTLKDLYRQGCKAKTMDCQLCLILRFRLLQPVLSEAGALLHQADDWFVKKREALKAATSLTDLDAMITQVLNYKDNICRRMEPMVTPVDPDPKTGEKDVPKPKRIKTVRRYDLCSVKRLQTQEDIDKYVESIKEKLLQTLADCDGIQIN